MRRLLPVVLLLALCCTSQMSPASTVSERVYRQLNEIHELRDADKHTEALRATDRLLNGRLDDHERAQTLLLKADILLQQERYKEAIVPMEAALAGGHVPKARLNILRYNLAQLYSQTERYRDAIKMMEIWLRDEPEPSANAYFMLAFAYLESHQLDSARKYADLGRNQTAQMTPGQYQFLGSIYLRQSDWRVLQKLLEEALLHYPKRVEFWKQLAQVHMEHQREAQALNVMRLAYTQGLLKRNDELVLLAQLMRLQNIPWMAAQVLENGLKNKQVSDNVRNLKMLGNSWIAAREYDKAYPPLLEAAKLEETPRNWIQLATLYAQNARWKDCEHSAQSGLRTGPKDPGPFYLLQGICAYEQGKANQALKALVAAKKSPKSAHEADGWIQFIEKL